MIIVAGPVTVMINELPAISALKLFPDNIDIHGKTHLCFSLEFSGGGSGSEPEGGSTGKQIFVRPVTDTLQKP